MTRYQDIYFSLPTRIVSGKGKLNTIGEELYKAGIKNPLIVTDDGVRKSGIIDSVENSLRKHSLAYSIFDEVQPNPDTVVLDSSLEYLKTKECDAVVGVGGGSSLDIAKALAIVAKNPGSILQYEGTGKVPNNVLPIYAVPTTAGTGSEATASTVITNSESLFKTVIISEYIFPRIAFLDPNLVVGLPRSVTAATGMDALTHAIESYVSKMANPISSALSYHAIKMIRKSLLASYEDGGDLDAREDMLLASLMAGIAFSQAKLGNVHAISHTFGGIFNIPHGLANAALLPYVMRFNISSSPELFRDIAEALGENLDGLDITSAAMKSIDAVLEMNKRMEVPSNIRDLGVDLQKIDIMITDSMRSGNIKTNPRMTGEEQIRNIIESSYNEDIEAIK